MSSPHIRIKTGFITKNHGAVLFGSIRLAVVYDVTILEYLCPVVETCVCAAFSIHNTSIIANTSSLPTLALVRKKVENFYIRYIDVVEMIETVIS